MKIAIKGHSTRGKEVIQILESLGGQNIHEYWGHSGDSIYYYINKHCKIVYDSIHVLSLYNYKLYTLEEFEKEFPFKVGDKVITIDGTIGIIDRFEPEKDYPYCIKADIGGFYRCATSILKPYKEMQKRNITLTLDKAKEWYKKGGELKEIALQAFTKEELNSFPRSWEEFATNHARMGYYISSDGKPLMCASSGKLSSPHVCPSKKSAEAHLAMIQLEQLRNCWWGNWKPEWSNSGKYVIKWEGDNLIVFTARRVHAFLVFPTREMAEEFLKCFKDLIEKAGDLI